MIKNIYKNLKNLGAVTAIPNSPKEAVLEKIKNLQNVDYTVRFTISEFTSLCPITKAPDFAYLIIDYIPNIWLLESKTLKLYLNSFRNHGAFHEDCTISIACKLIKLLKPKWLRIGGYWYPRGGIPIDVFYQTGKIPEGVWVKKQNVPMYRGRN